MPAQYQGKREGDVGLRIPRITIQVDFGDDQSLGTVGMQSIGYGLHQAWVYAAMFGGSAIFGLSPYATASGNSHVTIVYLVSIATFALTLLFAATTNQRLLNLWVSRKTAIVGAALTCAGTLLLALPEGGGAVGQAASGVATGVGTAILIVFWGVAFARMDGPSIVLNTALAVPFGLFVYSCVIILLPRLASSVAIAAIPLVELFIVLKMTPQPYYERDGVPIFKPLPVNRAAFLANFGIPTFVFGIVLGMLRQTSIQSLLPGFTGSSLMLAVIAAGFTTILLMAIIVGAGADSRWSRFFRPLVPFVAVVLLMLPVIQSGNGIADDLFLLVGYLSFEALMWVFFGDLSQRFRLSPVLVFGWGRGLLALAGLIGSLIPVFADVLNELSPFGEHGVVVLLMFIMVIAYTTLPREREIEAIIMPCPLVKKVSDSLEARPATRRAACPGAAAVNATDAGSPSRANAELGFAADAGAASATISEAAACAAAPNAGGAAQEALASAAARATNGGAGAVDAAGAADVVAGAAAVDVSAPLAATAASAIATNSPAFAASEPADAESARTAASPAAPAAAATTKRATAAAQAARIAPRSGAGSTFTATTPPVRSARERLARASMPAAAAQNDDAQRRKGRFRAKCEAVANTYLLSRREIEVMFYLAKGHNSTYIQEKLFISEGTAKTHIRHIYRKLDIHNQQELIRMVENAEVEGM